MKNNKKKPPSWENKRLYVRLRNKKEKKIKEILEELANKREKNLNDLVIEILKEYIKKAQKELSFTQIRDIVLEESLMAGSRKPKEEIESLKEWLYQRFPKKGQRTNFLLEWLNKHIRREYINQEEIAEEWENKIKEYGIINSLHEIDQEQLEQMFLDYLKKYFIIKQIGSQRNPNIIYLGNGNHKTVKFNIFDGFASYQPPQIGLFPRKHQVSDLIVDFFEKMHEPISEYDAEMLEDYLISIISPINDNLEAPSIDDEKSNSYNILRLLDLMLFNYRSLLKEIIGKFEASENLLKQILSLCSKIDVSKLLETEEIGEEEQTRLSLLRDTIFKMDVAIQQFRKRLLTKEGIVKTEQSLDLPIINQLRPNDDLYEAFKEWKKG